MINMEGAHTEAAVGVEADDGLDFFHHCRMCAVRDGADCAELYVARYGVEKRVDGKVLFDGKWQFGAFVSNSDDDDVLDTVQT